MLKNIGLFLFFFILFGVATLLYKGSKIINFGACITHKNASDTAEYKVLGTIKDNYILGVIEGKDIKRYLDPVLPYTKKDYIDSFYRTTVCPKLLPSEVTGLELSNDPQFQQIKINLMKEDLSKSLKDL